MQVLAEFKGKNLRGAILKIWPRTRLMTLGIPLLTTPAKGLSS